MLDSECCWQALCTRDAAFDGRFVFAVRSTGIYCRPSCPARRPLRHNVSFYPNAASAETAGFRPCRRCWPQGLSPAEQLDQLVTAACRLLDEAPQGLNMEQLAARIGLSASHLARAFKARTGLTPNAWSQGRRRARLEAELGQSDSVLQAALQVGYADTRALYQTSTGLSPAQRRQRGAGEHLHYAIAPCPLGLLLLAASTRGLCALLFGDSASDLESELRQRFAAARLQRDDQALRDWLEKVQAQIEEPGRAAQLPLDIRGTAYQLRVWQALQQIPSGQTRSYTELAQALDSHPRAIARACASNPLGLLVPCHRVLASGGGLSGYRWGVERKAELLRREQQQDGSEQSPSKHSP